MAQLGNRTLLNLNDSRLSSQQLQNIRSMLGRVDTLALQCSGASEYPICYTFDADEMRSRSLKKRQEKFELCRKIIKLIEPERVLFFAGPPVFLDPTIAELDEAGGASVFPDQLEILREFDNSNPDISSRSYLVVPGEMLADHFLYRRADLSAPRLLAYTQKKEYICQYAARRADLPPFDWGRLPSETKALAYFSHMARLSPYIGNSIGGAVTFVARESDGLEHAFTVDFATFDARLGRDRNALYVLTFPASCLEPVMIGLKTWDDIFLSMRMTFDERTDRFLPHLKTLLKYMYPPVFAAAQRYERHLVGEDSKIDMIEVEAGGRRHRIQRLCPHAGADLERQGLVSDDGSITCLAHRFCFDLTTGECLNARGYRLKVEK